MVCRKNTGINNGLVPRVRSRRKRGTLLGYTYLSRVEKVGQCDVSNYVR